jgi:hypothetical protein
VRWCGPDRRRSSRRRSSTACRLTNSLSPEPLRTSSTAPSRARRPRPPAKRPPPPDGAVHADTRPAASRGGGGGGGGGGGVVLLAKPSRQRLPSRSSRTFRRAAARTSPIDSPQAPASGTSESAGRRWFRRTRRLRAPGEPRCETLRSLVAFLDGLLTVALSVAALVLAPYLRLGLRQRAPLRHPLRTSTHHAASNAASASCCSAAALGVRRSVAPKTAAESAKIPPIANAR